MRDTVNDRPGCTFRAECGTSKTRRAALLDGLALDFATSLTNWPGRVSLESV